MSGSSPEIGRHNWQQYADARVDPKQWTAVIPAAGRATRLRFHRPKILYPVAGLKILDWLIDLLLPCSTLIFVISPDWEAEISGELDVRIPGRFKVVIQETPKGMGDAVALALPAVETVHVAIVWGDQVALRRGSVEACQRLQQGPLQPDLTFPTIVRADPYIHFERDSDGKITAVRQLREGDSMPRLGESDGGLFCFRTAVLARVVTEAQASGEISGSSTGEFNLLPVIPLTARRGTVLTPRVITVEETIGINTPEDAAAVEEFLRSTHASNQC